MNPTSFAEVLCEDLHISDSEGLVPIIVQQIIRQVEDYRKHAPMALFERVQLSQGREGDQGGGDVWADNAGDLRIPVQLNVVVDKVHLHDQFEWDVTCWRNSPETFADIVTREERLEPEFR